ncbi:MAG: cation diffusion facilitator family transporter [Pseudomonadota bacterium]
MGAGGSTRFVVITLAANAIGACAKLAAFAYTGSSAMLAQAVQSLVGASSQGLLLSGQARATGPADQHHPIGRSGELAVWRLVVAILLFALGAGVAISEGVHQLTDPQPIRNAWVNYIVLGAAFVIEGRALFAAIHTFRARHRGEPALDALRASSEPVLFPILFETAAALIGLAVALTGVLLADQFGIQEADGVASIAIGLLLAYVAAISAVEVKRLFDGEPATPSMRDGIRDIIAQTVRGEASVREITAIETMQLGATSVFVTARLAFDDRATAADVAVIAQQIEIAVRAHYANVTKVVIAAQPQAELLAKFEADA